MEKIKTWYKDGQTLIFDGQEFISSMPGNQTQKIKAMIQDIIELQEVH